MPHFTRQYKDTLQKRLMISMSFCSKFIRVLCTSNYSNKERFDKVITKIKWCSFLPHSLVRSFWKHRRQTENSEPENEGPKVAEVVTVRTNASLCCWCRRDCGRSNRSHPHLALLNRDIRHRQQAVARQLPAAVPQVLHHRCHRARRRCSRRTAARCHARLGLLRPGTVLAVVFNRSVYI